MGTITKLSMTSQPTDVDLATQHALAPSPAVHQQSIKSISLRAIASFSWEDPAVYLTVLVRDRLEFGDPKLQDKEGLTVEVKGLRTLVFVCIASQRQDQQQEP